MDVLRVGGALAMILAGRISDRFVLCRTSDFSIHSCVYLNLVFINLTECTQKKKLSLI